MGWIGKVWDSIKGVGKTLGNWFSAGHQALSDAHQIATAAGDVVGKIQNSSLGQYAQQKSPILRDALNATSDALAQTSASLGQGVAMGQMLKDTKNQIASSFNDSMARQKRTATEAGIE